MLTKEEFEFVQEHEDVERLENNGTSGSYIGKIWYTVYLADQAEYDIYEA